MPRAVAIAITAAITIVASGVAFLMTENVVISLLVGVGGVLSCMVTALTVLLAKRNRDVLAEDDSETGVSSDSFSRFVPPPPLTVDIRFVPISPSMSTAGNAAIR